MSFVKIVFEVGVENCNTESLWATEVDGGFMLENVPFYVMDVSYEDIVEAEQITDELAIQALGHADKRQEVDGVDVPVKVYQFQRVIKPAASSLFRVWYTDEDHQAASLQFDTLRELGCTVEVAYISFAAICVPLSVHDQACQLILDGMNSDLWNVQTGVYRNDDEDDE